MTPELLTQEELDQLREHGNASWPPFVKLLRAYEALVQQVAELEAERNTERRGRELCSAAIDAYQVDLEQLRSALATEKAAREAAEQDKAELCDALDARMPEIEARHEATAQRVWPLVVKLRAAESEAAALRARVAELEGHAEVTALELASCKEYAVENEALRAKLEAAEFEE